MLHALPVHCEEHHIFPTVTGGKDQVGHNAQGKHKQQQKQETAEEAESRFGIPVTEASVQQIDKYHKKHDDPKGKADHFPGGDQDRRAPQHIILIDPAILSVLTQVDVFRDLLPLNIRLAVNLPGCFSLPCTGFFFFSSLFCQSFLPGGIRMKRQLVCRCFP